MPFDTDNHIDRPLLEAVLDRIVPPDRDGGAVDLGVVDFVLAMLNGDASAQLPRITAGLVSVDSRSVTIHGESFAAIDQAARDEILRAVEGEDWFASLCELAADGVYADPANGGNRNGAGWRMIGYKHGLPDGPSGPVGSTPAPARLLGMETSEFDVIIVGAGAGGGVAACVLAEAGKKVLLIDRGARRTYLDSGHRDHLRNHRLSVYGHNTGPELDGNPRVCVSQSGLETIVRPNETDYGNNASCLGSGTFLYGGLAWRFHPDDFRMATRYGVPDGSSLTDWPFGYDELEYWYDRAEWEIGVSGDPAGCSHEPWRSRPYPMPPVAETRATHLLRTGADNLGIDTFSVPLLINTAPRQGRAACIECGSCVGFPCPVDAKNGTQNTVVERAIASGNCTLWTDMMVTRIETDDRGKVIGVAAITPAKVGQSNRISIRSKAVVLAAGAVETARLLLMSASAREPEGLGNTRDLVGRNMQAHLYPTVFGLFDDEVHSSRGPGVTLATTAYNHGNPGIIGGAMLADDFVMLPAIFWRSALPPGMRRWGAESKEFMRRNFRHVLQVKGPVHEIPVPTAQVDLARDVRDRFGLPVARLSGSVHNETMRTIDFMTAKARGWLQASGARETWHTPITPRLSVGQHQAGTCRMGSDPATSVTDIFGRVWHHSNLFISDASLHPTNGGFNPVLTVMALAFRNASKIARLI